MSKKYSIDRAAKTLVFAGKPKSLNKDSVGKKDKTRFTSVVIPNSVSAIDERTFKYCHALTSANIPNSVSIIGDEAFTHCAALAYIHIPNSINSIDSLAFNNCHALASIYIPNAVSSIRLWSFRNCSRLHKACVPNSPEIHSAISPTFATQTTILRPRLTPITSLQKKSACRASKSSYSIYL